MNVGDVRYENLGIDNARGELKNELQSKCENTLRQIIKEMRNVKICYLVEKNANKRNEHDSKYAKLSKRIK